MKYLVAVAALAACADSSKGLEFFGTPVHDGQLVNSEDAPTAVGGMQMLYVSRSDDSSAALPPYVAEADRSIFEIVGQDGPKVTVRALAEGTGELTIRGTDGQLMAATSLAAKRVDRVEVVPVTYDQYPHSDAQLYGPSATVAVSLFDVHGNALVDTSMQLALAGSERIDWDELYVPMTGGSVTLTVTAGDHQAIDLPLEVVTAADTIALLGTTPSIPPHGSATICFEATNAGRPVFGLKWEFAVDNHLADTILLAPDCVVVATEKTSGTVSIIASVPGAFTTVSLPVMAR